MFCTTECWDCEDKTCKHYISKSQLYFENQQLKQVLDEIREYINDNVAVYAFNNPELPHWEFNDDDIEHILQILDKVKE